MFGGVHNGMIMSKTKEPASVMLKTIYPQKLNHSKISVIILNLTQVPDVVYCSEEHLVQLNITCSNSTTLMINITLEPPRKYYVATILYRGLRFCMKFDQLPTSMHT